MLIMIYIEDVVISKSSLFALSDDNISNLIIDHLMNNSFKGNLFQYNPFQPNNIHRLNPQNTSKTLNNPINLIILIKIQLI
jgi:hypothetical protein